VGKIIFWIVVFFAVLFVLRMINVAKSKAREKARQEAKQIPPAEPTVRCIKCGTFLPASEATQVATGYRCNDPACANRR
jgi:ribosomal protein S26